MSRRRLFTVARSAHGGVIVAVTLSLLLPGAGLSQGVEISDTSISISGEEVLTMGHATPLYARGTGANNPANRAVKLGDGVLVNGTGRGLTLTILDTATHSHVSSDRYDTFGSTGASNSLAVAIRSLGNNQIGILTSYDAFEAGITEELRAAASQLGLYRLATIPIKPWRHPYAAIFYGSGPSTPGRQALEILQSNAPDAPRAVLTSWLIGDGFAGQGATPPTSGRATSCRNDNQNVVFVDCLNGTVTDNRTGLVWLKDASCNVLGQREWNDAMLGVMALADGMCGLSDGSSPGDWRLPTIGEFCSRDAPTVVAGACPPESAVDSLVNTSFSSPTVSNAAGDAQWSEGNPFSGVESGSYWSATESGTLGVWFVDLSDGVVSATNKDCSICYVWPVRGGQ